MPSTKAQRLNPRNADPNGKHLTRGYEYDGITTTSYSLPRDLHIRWVKRLPKNGSRSKVLRKLIEMFLDGKVAVYTGDKRI